MNRSARVIIDLNVRHYRALLSTEQNPDKQRVLKELLAAELQKLVKSHTDAGSLSANSSKFASICDSKFATGDGVLRKRRATP
jgi:hypothetical protein